VKTTGPPVGNVVPIARAFDGTTAAVHLASAVVSGFVDAYHHNRLVAEVEAIENALGANLSKIPAVSQIVSSAYDFPAQTPGGNLAIGNNVITLSPVPLGVNGSDPNHYLYISGGTGTAEPVLITGGTAVSGATSGTVIVNCANAHSGAWTIRSATAGIREAISALPGGSGAVLIPSGTFTVYGPVIVSGSAVVLRGTGRQATTLNTSYTAGPIITFGGSATQSNNQLIGLSINGAGTGSNYAVLIDSQNSFSMEDVAIGLVGGGIRVIGTTSFRILIDNVNVSYCTGNAISIENGADHLISRVMINGNSASTSTGISIVQSGGTWIWDCDVIACNTGLLMGPGSGAIVSWIWVTDSAFDTCITTGIFISPAAGGTVKGVNLVNCWTASSSGSGGGGVNGTGAVIGSTGTVDGIRLIGHRFVANNTNGMILFGGTHLLVDSAVFAGNGNGLQVGAGVSNWTVRNSQIGASDGFGNTQNYGIAITSGASDNFAIENNSFFANITGAISNGATGTHNIIRNNQGYNPVGQTAITVGPSPFTYTAGPSPENIYITGGTVSSIKVGATQIATASPATIPLPPNGSLTVIYSAAPTMVKDIL
jgi:hypothetical protein